MNSSKKSSGTRCRERSNFQSSSTKNQNSDKEVKLGRRNLTFLSLVGLAVVLALGASSKFANAGVSSPNECRGADFISCHLVDDDDVEIWAKYDATNLDDDDVRLLQPADDDDTCNANNISFHVKATDGEGGLETNSANPCDSCEVKVPLGDVVVDDDDCTFHEEDDDFVECHVNCELSLQDNCDPNGNSEAAVIAHSKGQTNPAKGRGVNNGNDKVETSAFCGDADLDGN